MVPYTLDALFASNPTQRVLLPIDGSYYPGVFAARWPASSFATHGEFIRLVEMYSSAMQGFIQGMSPQELNDWFIPREDGDLKGPPPAITPLRSQDATDWLQQNLPGIDIPWLKPGDHTEILDEEQGKFGHVNAHGPAGYLSVFVADEV